MTQKKVDTSLFLDYTLVEFCFRCGRFDDRGTAIPVIEI